MGKPSKAVAGAINQVPQVVRDYGADPRGIGLFASLAGTYQTAINGHDGLVYVGDQGAPEQSFNGDLGQNLQHFTGAAALVLYGAARPIPNGGSATFETAQAVDALNDLPLRIFAARAARRSS